MIHGVKEFVLNFLTIQLIFAIDVTNNMFKEIHNPDKANIWIGKHLDI